MASEHMATPRSRRGLITRVPGHWDLRRCSDLRLLSARGTRQWPSVRGVDHPGNNHFGINRSITPVQIAGFLAQSSKISMFLLGIAANHSRAHSPSRSLSGTPVRLDLNALAAPAPLGGSEAEPSPDGFWAVLKIENFPRELVLAQSTEVPWWKGKSLFDDSQLPI